MKRVLDSSSKISAETDAEMTERHIKEEMNLLSNIRDQIRNLADSLEDLHEVAYNTMEVNALYEECLDVLQAWPANYRSYVNGSNLENRA